KNLPVIGFSSWRTTIRSGVWTILSGKGIVAIAGTPVGLHCVIGSSLPSDCRRSMNRSRAHGWNGSSVHGVPGDGFDGRDGPCAVGQTSVAGHQMEEWEGGA